MPALSDTSVEHPPTAAIVFEDVHLSFEDNAVLRGVSFHLPLGETKALFGVAGSGKSTILKLAMGLLPPDSGRITVLGNEVTHMREQDMFPMRGHVGMVFQESALFDSLTVSENVAFRLLEEHGIYTTKLTAAYARHSASWSWSTPSTCSHQNSLAACVARVAIARAIITQPELLLYDSPTGGLDPVTSNTIVELIMKQRDVYKTSSLLVTHRLQDAFTMATHQFDKQTNQVRVLPRGQYCDVPMSFLILRDGKVIFDGDVRQLAHTKDEYIREYIS